MHNSLSAVLLITVLNIAAVRDVDVEVGVWVWVLVGSVRTVGWKGYKGYHSP